MPKLKIPFNFYTEHGTFVLSRQNVLQYRADRLGSIFVSHVKDLVDDPDKFFNNVNMASDKNNRPHMKRKEFNAFAHLMKSHWLENYA